MQKPIYWECTVNNHQKFWAAHIIEDTEYVKRSKGMNRFAIKYVLVRKWGKIGTKGQRMEQKFDDKYEAEKALEDLIWFKEKKGYKPVF